MNKGKVNNILETIGNTPLIKLNQVTKDLKATVLAKVEYFNPGGSIKDRIAITIIESAEKSGQLKPGGTIVESTSGNTGAGLALVAALKGYKAILTMPDKMSTEKVRLLKAYGADVVVTPTAVPPDSPESYYEVAKKIVRETPNAILANQYFNPVNPETHYKTTAPEIWEQTRGNIDYLVAGMGTGGTISGIGKFLKEKNPDIKVIGADPVGSVIKTYFETKEMSGAKPYKVEGIGEDIIPGTLHFEYIDEIYHITDKESFNLARKLAKDEGLFVGGSSGTAACAALKIAKNLDEDKVVVVIFPDTGERYLSKFYSDEWMQENRLFDIEKISLQNVLGTKTKEIPALVYVTPDELVSEALTKMKAYNISQLPVLENNKSLGSLEEGNLMGQVIEDNSLFDCPVKEIMQESFPVIQQNEGIENVKKLLSQRNSAVLIEDVGKFVGIITKVDLLDFISP